MPKDRLSWKRAIGEMQIELDGIVSSAKPLVDRGATPSNLVSIHTKREISPTSDSEKSIVFARRCVDAGWIGDDLGKHTILINVLRGYRKSNFNFFDKIRLEAFLRARIMANKGETDALVQYAELGQKIDPDWFGESLADVEDFVAKQTADSASREYGADDLGAYRLDRHGNKWREAIGIGDDGYIIYSFTTPDRSRLLISGDAGKGVPERRNPYSSLS